MKQKQKSFPLSPQEYKQQLKTIELTRIELESCSARLRKDRFKNITDSIKLDVTNKAQYKIINEKKAVFSQHFTLIGTTTTKRDYGLKIECTLLITIEKLQGQFTKEFLDTYMIINLDLISWPYFREFVHNITCRMDIPPLVLPLIKKG